MCVFGAVESGITVLFIWGMFMLPRVIIHTVRP